MLALKIGTHYQVPPLDNCPDHVHGHCFSKSYIQVIVWNLFKKFAHVCRLNRFNRELDAYFRSMNLRNKNWEGLIGSFKGYRESKFEADRQTEKLFIGVELERTPLRFDRSKRMVHLAKSTV